MQLLDSQGYQKAEFQDFTFNNNILRNDDSSVFAKYEMLHLSRSKNDEVSKNTVLMSINLAAPQSLNLTVKVIVRPCQVHTTYSFISLLLLWCWNLIKVTNTNTTA